MSMICSVGFAVSYIFLAISPCEFFLIVSKHRNAENTIYRYYGLQRQVAFLAHRSIRRHEGINNVIVCFVSVLKFLAPACDSLSYWL